MKISEKGKRLLKELEGCRLTAYKDGNGYAIGYGHYGASAGETITQAEADSLLEQDLAKFETAVESLGASLSQSQFDACVIMSYNIGSSAFKNSTAARLIKESTTPRQELEDAWKMWKYSGGTVSEGLEKRRAREYSHYCSGAGMTSTIKNNYKSIIIVCASLAILVVAAILLIKTNNGKS